MTWLVVSGGKIVKPTYGAPVREHYTLKDWYTDSACTTVYNFNNTVTANRTLYAGWKPVSYSVTYETYGGTITNEPNYEKYTYSKGLTLPTVYLIEGRELTASADGSVPIDEKWFGKTISIIRKGNGVDLGDSEAQLLPVPNRPAGPEQVKPRAESKKNGNNGKLTKTDTTMQYRKKGSTEWSSVTGEEVTDLEPGDYEIRYVSTDTAFASEIVVKEVKKYSPPKADDKKEEDGENNNPGGETPPSGDDTGGSQPGGTTPGTGVKPDDGTEPGGGAKPGEGTAPEHTVDDGRIVPKNPSGDGMPGGQDSGGAANTHPYAVGKTVEALTIPVDAGAVIVIVNNIDENLCTAQAADAVAVANAVLTEEEIARVSAGETVEIRIDVERIDERVSEQDKALIEQGIGEAQEETAGLTVGMYVDISMFLRRGKGEWSAVHETNEPVEIVIDMPEELSGLDADFYIARAHAGECTLLQDLDDEAETITIETERFSTYAIAYRLTDVGAGLCSLCHICPTFLGICYFIWLAVIIAAVIIVMLVWRRKKDKEPQE